MNNDDENIVVHKNDYTIPRDSVVSLHRYLSNPAQNVHDALLACGITTRKSEEQEAIICWTAHHLPNGTWAGGENFAVSSGARARFKRERNALQALDQWRRNQPQAAGRFNAFLAGIGGNKLVGLPLLVIVWAICTYYLPLHWTETAVPLAFGVALLLMFVQAFLKRRHVEAPPPVIPHLPSAASSFWLDEAPNPNVASWRLGYMVQLSIWGTVFYFLWQSYQNYVPKG